MNFDEKERGVDLPLTGVLSARRVSFEATGELVLPDTQPEARRILAVSERVLPPVKYTGNNAVECNGVVDYRVIYLGIDGEVWGACFSSEYEVTMPYEIDGSGFDSPSAFALVSCDGTTARLSAGKRISVKSRMLADIWALGEVAEGREALCDNDEEMRLKYSVANTSRVFSADSEVIELNDRIDGLGECRIVSADAEAFVSERRADRDGASLSGEIAVKLLIVKAGGAVETVLKKVPLSGRVELHEVGETSEGDLTCSLRAAVTDIEVEMSEGCAELSLSVVIYAICSKNRSVSYIDDAYSLDRECFCRYSERNILGWGACADGNFTDSVRTELSGTEIPEGANIIDVFGRVLLDGCEVGAKRDLSGRCRYTLLWEKDREYGTCEVTSDLRYSLDGGDAKEGFCGVCAEVVGCRGRIEGDMLRIDGEVYLSAFVMGKDNLRLLGDIEIGDVIETDRNRMIVYYPAESESAWDVAKKYRISPENLVTEKKFYIL